MISVMNERDIGRSSADPSFGMGNPEEGTMAGDKAAADEVGHGSDESRVSMELDPVELKSEVGGTVLERGVADLSGPRKDAPVDAEAAMSEARVLESDVGEGVSAAADAGAEILVADQEEGRDFDEDGLSDEAEVSDGVRIPHGTVGNWTNGFELGDMVWGKVKSHPWWPGHIFSEAFASPSVRRTKGEGHVLVAFFGDSSYGWFDPAELIPFDPHYAEKSKQTTLRPFVKAVEEAADETSRREALAVTCYCRNTVNIRPARVPGYFYVDVPGFEPGGVYSSKQINSTRDKFSPEKALAFVLQTALDPLAGDQASIDQIKNIAMMFAYRRAVFEEFDETYAQAFGVEPVRPSSHTGSLSDQPERFAPRATPLSGPLVVAEPLRHKKISSNANKQLAPKAAKLPPSAKKNKYVLKRRDEQETPSTRVGPPKPSLPDFPSPAHPFRSYYNLLPPQQPISAHYAPHVQPTLVFQDASYAPASAAGGSNLGDYVLQKRAPTVVASADDKLPPQVSQDTGGDRPVPEQKTLPVAVDAPIVVSPRQAASQLGEIEFGKVDPAVAAAHVLAEVKDGYRAGLLARPAEGWKSKDAKVTGGIMKKVKKRPREDGGSSVGPDGTAADVTKKKKKKKERSGGIGLPVSTKVEDPHGRSAGKPVSVEGESLRRGDGVARAVEPYASAILLPQIDLSSRTLQLPELVSDLQELALDPFYGMDRDAPWVALHVFLRFRSLVYQKSLALPPASEAEAPDVQAGKSLAARPPHEPIAALAEVAPSKAAKDERASPSIPKQPRASFRPDDPTVAGRKRTPSDRQEEMSAKKQKKMEKLKALAGEKKVTIIPKVPDAQLQQQQQQPSAAASVSVGPAKPNNKAAEPVKKQEPLPPPPRAPSPTTLVMKFPPRTTLPSVASLKAKFARFGPLELSGFRVYWKSNTCKVVYKFKPDAEAALNHARSNEMFGQVKVHYYLRDADAPLVPEPASDAAGQRSEGPQFVRPGSGASGGSVSFALPPAGQLKSILKKSSDEAGAGGGATGSREAPRVKFMLDNVDGKAEPPVVVAGNGRSNADAPSTSLPPVATVISKTPKSVTFLSPPPPPPPSSAQSQSYPSRLIHNPYLPSPPPLSSFSSVSIPPPPSLRVSDRALAPPPPHRGSLNRDEARGPVAAQSSDLPPHNYRQHGGEVEERGNPNGDFANQMLSLLIRCSDIVSSVKSSLGYVPYHPL
ncbi:PWWP domain-containing protein 1 [Musa acuminata AAA Group]|uniref:PWWP domain-containing protein 1 n=1 Tax=Musa acuminata AAA Group TaxID=214697 RepID=UPI0031D2B408